MSKTIFRNIPELMSNMYHQNSIENLLLIIIITPNSNPNRVHINIKSFQKRKFQNLVSQHIKTTTKRHIIKFSVSISLLYKSQVENPSPNGTHINIENSKEHISQNRISPYLKTHVIVYATKPQLQIFCSISHK